MYYKMNRNFTDSHGLIYDLIINGDGKGAATIIAADPIPTFDIGSILPDLSCLPPIDRLLAGVQYTCSYEWENGKFRLIGFFYQGEAPSSVVDLPGIKCEIMPLDGSNRIVTVAYLLDENVTVGYTGTFLIGMNFKRRYYPRFDTMTAVPCEPKCFRKLYEVVFENGREIARNPISRWNTKIREYVKAAE